MEADILKIGASNAEGISRHKEKIERLFGVRLDIQEDPETSPENGVPQSCTCRLSNLSPNAHNNIEKAKRYVQALIADGPDFSIVTETYVQPIVENILFNKENIEQECCAIITASQGNNTISIKGSKQDVERAKHFTDSIAASVLHDSSCLSEFTQDLQSIESCHGSRSRDAGQLHDPSSESSDDGEDTDNEVRKDPDFHNKLEFAFKLGYTEADLIKALQSLGQKAGQNELLSELIKNNAVRQDSADGADTETSAEGGVDEDVTETQVQHKQTDTDSPLRHIIIDGSNVAMSHGNKELFSCQGIKLAVDWFKERGHTNITVFVPQWRKETSRSDARISDQHILNALEKDKVLVFTPSRRIGGKRVVCYDDRFVLKLAVETDGIVVSNDNYRDLIGENEQFKKVVEERLLMYTFVNDRFMPPDDPLGRNGPTLDNFLLKEPAEPEPLPPPCPYGSKKCTYGNKCKYYHPERRTQPHKSVTEKLAEQAKLRMLEMRQRENAQQSNDSKKKLTRTKTPLQRTSSLTPQFSQNPYSIPDKNQADGLDDYNQKLSEGLLRMELERTMSEPFKTMPNSPRTPEKADYSPRARFGDPPDSRASPRMLELKQKVPGSPRETSPVNLVVPGHTEQRDDSQKFLSGHLALAKKLSDEANESDKLKKKQKSKEDGQSVISPLAYTGIEGPVQKEMVKKPLARSKEKLSRQLSLQGGEDPRLAQGRMALQAQLSYDPRRISQDNLGALNPQDRHMMMKDFMYVQQRDLMGEGASFGENSSQKKKSLARDMSRGHASVTRMQSAPDPFLQSQSSNHLTPRMMRQNSSSDTQLNRLCSFNSDELTEGILARGSRDGLPMKDSTGSITFQIGRPVSNMMARNQSQLSPGLPVEFSGCLYSPKSHGDTFKHQTLLTDFQPGQQTVAPNYHLQQLSHYTTPQQMMSSDFQQTVSPNYHGHEQTGSQIYQPHQQSGNYHSYPQTASQDFMSRQQTVSQDYLHHQQTVSQDFQSHQQTVSQGYQQFNQTVSPNYAHNQHSISQDFFPHGQPFLPSNQIMPRQQSNLGQVQFSQANVQYSESSSVWNPKSPHLQNVGRFQEPFVQRDISPHVMASPNSNFTTTNMSPVLSQPVPIDTAILPNSPRYKLYTSLCGLFPEETVRTVMNQHPNIEDPKQLCSYIINYT